MTDQVTEDTATISWDPVQAVIDKYMVRYTSADGDTREVSVGKEQSSTVLTGLRPGVEYTVQVWAQKGDRESKKADTKALTGTVRTWDEEPCTSIGTVFLHTWGCGGEQGRAAASPEAFLRGVPSSPL